MNHSATLRAGDALLIVDVQNDFLPGGALAVPDADAIVPVLNRYLAAFAAARLPIFASRDWHPADHCSFRERGGRWPPHAVADTPGAGFPGALALPSTTVVISKATERDREAYSVFAGTLFEEVLRGVGVKRLFVAGLVTEQDVLQTVRDAIAQKFGVVLLRDAIRPMSQEGTEAARATEEMRWLGAESIGIEDMLRWRPEANPLLADLSQFTMLRGYYSAAMDGLATFEFFIRKLPAGWSFLIAAGLEQVLDYLESLEFTTEHLEALQRLGFGPATLERLQRLRFTGEVHALPEGTVFFPDEPILRVTAPLPEAQLVETRVVNLLHFQTLIASKAARCVLAAPGKDLVDYGLRRAHGAEAGILAARACYLAGFAATSDVLAAQSFGLPVSGTMAHSFVEACESEEQAFLCFARANPRQVVLLIDTYDTLAAARKVVRLAPVLKAEGIPIWGVRLDSGDLATQARRVREILDAGGLRDLSIFASGNLDEMRIEELVVGGAPIDGFGVGSRAITSADAPYLDCAYKLQVYRGRPRCKLSPEKGSWPGEKQVYREVSVGAMHGDVISLATERELGEPLLECVMKNGVRTTPSPSLAVVRERLARQLDHLPLALRNPICTGTYPVRRSKGLIALADQLGLTAGRSTGASIPRGDAGSASDARFLHRINEDEVPAEWTGDGEDGPRPPSR